MALAGDSFELQLSDGSKIGGKVHSSFTHNKRLLGRCLDLASPYKQLPLHPRDRCNAAISVYNPTLMR
eukprot:4259764-Amphidinium_carterae.1